MAEYGILDCILIQTSEEFVPIRRIIKPSALDQIMALRQSGN